MDWEKCAKALKKGISISKKVATKVIEYSLEEQANAQRRMDSTRSHIRKMSDEELERKVKKAYKDEGKHEVETMMMAQEYMQRKKNQ